MCSALAEDLWLEAADAREGGVAEIERGNGGGLGYNGGETEDAWSDLGDWSLVGWLPPLDAVEDSPVPLERARRERRPEVDPLVEPAFDSRVPVLLPVDWDGRGFKRNPESGTAD